MSKPDEFAPVGLKYLGEITLTIDFANQPRPAYLDCAAEPCAWCFACGVCGDFHGNHPEFVPCRGCTDQTS